MLNAKRLKFIDKMVHTQDLKMSAKLSGYEPEYGLVLYAIPEIREEIDRRLLILHTEEAKLTAKEKVLGRDLLDRELIKVVESDVSPTKLNAIVLGYRRVGMMAGDDFIPEVVPSLEHRPNEPPRIFKATQTSILAHRIETTTQTVTKELVAEKPPYDF